MMSHCTGARRSYEFEIMVSGCAEEDREMWSKEGCSGDTNEGRRWIQRRVL